MERMLKCSGETRSVNAGICERGSFGHDCRRLLTSTAQLRELLALIDDGATAATKAQRTYICGCAGGDGGTSRGGW